MSLAARIFQISLPGLVACSMTVRICSNRVLNVSTMLRLNGTLAVIVKFLCSLLFFSIVMCNFFLLVYIVLSCYSPGFGWSILGMSSSSGVRVVVVRNRIRCKSILEESKGSSAAVWFLIKSMYFCSSIFLIHYQSVAFQYQLNLHSFLGQAQH